MWVSKVCQKLKKIAIGAYIDSAIICPIKKVRSRIWKWFHLKVYKWDERKNCFGELYPNKTFYVIRVRPITSSIGPLVMWACRQLAMCDMNGYIPVIDFSFFKNVFLEESEGGRVNPWEYYFEQPTMYSTRAVYHAKNVILGKADVEDISVDALVDDENILKKYCIVYEKYIHISKRIEKKVEKIYNEIFEPDWKVLGCVYRGTDYRNRKIVNEHRQPSLTEEIAKAQELMGEWKCDHIFLATEDIGAVDEFKRIFGDKLLYVNKERYPSDVSTTRNYKFNREQDAYYKGEEYLIEICMLSRCNCLLSSRVGILMAALPMNNLNYEHKYIYDLGLYTEMDYVEKC